jgi:RNA polymerase sigma-70 factor (ECF subfamily)
MRRACDGDADAFAELYDRHGERALRVARAICRDAGHAEDAVHEGFLAIWRGRATYQEGDADFQSWAMRIVRDRATESSQGTAGRSSSPPREEDGDRSLLASLRLLPDAQAEVIVLAVFGDLTHAQIARQLDLPAGTVEGRMRLGLQKLRDQMTVTE